ncbi:related to CYTOCHROME B561 [Phialocephala subalpina]|uniref:Related to CYTOCHROME B561 n=1 Tax=Phialocephala subalpina TaxID=576137 RepID=A0A1L7WYX6_9HELO|nr:related to CYTOCHROME B561 [Phialocephala subalpina]
MASATGIPDGPVLPRDVGEEEEPLLGRPGGATQQEGKSLWYNLIIGTAVIAQVGIILLIASVWASIFLSDLILFSAHPLLNSAGLLFLTQGILVVQPTHTLDQKRHGTAAHFILNNFGIDALLAGLIVIEVNKFNHNGTHFESPHAILGLITYILLAIQAFVGFTQYYTPSLYGSVDNAKSLYKYHRISGYVILTLLLATVAAATQTDFNKTTLDIKLWAVLVTAILVLIGVIPRIKKQKLGLKGSKKPTTLNDDLTQSLN